MNYDIIFIIILVIYFIISVYFKFTSKILVIALIACIIIASIITIQNDLELANDIAESTFYLLIVTIALIVIENYRDIKKNKNKKMER